MQKNKLQLVLEVFTYIPWRKNGSEFFLKFYSNLPHLSRIFKGTVE